MEVATTFIMHMPMCQLFRSSRAHACHGAIEGQRLAGQRMVTVHRHFIVGHITTV